MGAVIFFVYGSCWKAALSWLRKISFFTDKEKEIKRASHRFLHDPLCLAVVCLLALLVCRMFYLLLIYPHKNGAF